MSTVWRVIQFILGVIFMALGIMTNVTPEQAESNLSAWFSNPPSWLRTPSVDLWGEMLFFCLAALMFLSLAWPWMRRLYYLVRKDNVSVPTVTKPDGAEQFKADLKQRAAANRRALSNLQHQRPLYAPPADAKGIDLSSATYKELGRLTVSIANDIIKLIENNRHNRTSSEVALFNGQLASHFLWVYEEIRNRGHRDSDLDRYFENPANITNVRHLANKLKEVGSRLPLYLDT